jgi:hypothetical protein
MCVSVSTCAQAGSRVSNILTVSVLWCACEQAFDDERAVFFGYFVPTAESSAAGGVAAAQTLQEKMRAAYGNDFAARLLSGEARPLPEHYDEVTVASLTVPAAAATAARLGEIAERHRVHKMRGDGERLVCVTGTNHVAHDLAFDQARNALLHSFLSLALSYSLRPWSFRLTPRAVFHPSPSLPLSSSLLPSVRLSHSPTLPLYHSHSHSIISCNLMRSNDHIFYARLVHWHSNSKPRCMAYS